MGCSSLRDVESDSLRGNDTRVVGGRPGGIRASKKFTGTAQVFFFTCVLNMDYINFVNEMFFSGMILQRRSSLWGLF